MEFNNILLERKDQLAFITINRPEVRNTLNKNTLEEIIMALEHIRQDHETGCLVFTGSGEKSFAAGADIAQLEKKSGIDALNPSGMQEVYDKIESFEKPTIAMVNGFALGGGCELAMSCDLRIASKNAKFGLPELNLSIIPGAGGTQRLARLIGKGKAMEWILTGKIVAPEEAYQFGLVSEVTEPDELLATTKEWASSIMAKGPLAVHLAKLSVNLGYETDMKTGLAIEKLSQAVLFDSDDKTEGTRAFIEKRKPAFKGI
ncbi:enoyl-CoA hydratase/isomerase family protein [Alteribacillus sp. JSM 102045]|uniref:enoyl-CoA hydratase/isomerase family protein n=1 Tax=Alteribacillus sp. JSM 102045 TaxID=1562101 RepID=UPI0035BF8A78